MKQHLLERTQLSKPVSITGALAAIVGIILSCIILVEKLALAANPEYKTSCSFNPIISCQDVMGSWQAGVFWGFPNPLIGVIGFTAVLMLFVIGALVPLPRYVLALQSAGLLGALVFCFWLASQALYDIQAICLYCVGVWVTVSLLTTLSVRNLLSSAWKGLAWGGFSLLLVGFASMIFFAFPRFWLSFFS